MQSIQEALVEESQSKAVKSKSKRPYLKNSLQHKGIEVWLKWYSTCQENMKHEFEPLFHKKKKKELFLKVIYHWAPVAHAYNPSYSESRDQEDHSSKPAWANSLGDPISKKPSQNRAGGVVQVVESLLSKHEA
jgi:hypothetical protein